MSLTNSELIFTGAKDQHITGIVKLNHHNNPRGALLIFIVSMRRMWLREVKEVSQGHTGGRGFASIPFLLQGPRACLSFSPCLQQNFQTLRCTQVSWDLVEMQILIH